ncbi:MAG TPA: hypothetical protein PK509_07975 [Catalimonadaceae bacterium]|nr:hypothetical protein [Catalimonadaceae bacterium]
MKTNETDALQEVILLLEQRQQLELSQLKHQAGELYENAKPANLLHHFTDEIRNTPHIKLKLLQVGLGWISGYVIKRMVTGSSPTLVRKIFGNLSQFFFRKLISGLLSK